MLLRFGSEKLRSFWPVIVAELMRIFSLQSHDPNLILAAVKFLDIALVLPSDSFNYYEWIFLADRFAGAAAGDAAFNFARQNDVGFTPFVSQLCETVPDDSALGDDAQADGAAGSGSAPHETSVADLLEDDSDALLPPRHTRLQHCSEASPDGLVRPIILAKSINEFDESGGFPGKKNNIINNNNFDLHSFLFFFL